MLSALRCLPRVVCCSLCVVCCPMVAGRWGLPGVRRLSAAGCYSVFVVVVVVCRSECVCCLLCVASCVLVAVVS